MKQTDRELPGTGWHRQILLWIICMSISFYAFLHLNPMEVSAAQNTAEQGTYSDTEENRAEKNLSAAQSTAEQAYFHTGENGSAENTEQWMEERIAGSLEFAEIEQFLKEKDQTGIRFQDLKTCRYPVS